MANLIITAIIGAMLGFISSVAYFMPKYEAVISELNARPPIVVIDMIKLAADAIPLKADRAATEEHFKNTQNVINKYVDSGYIVLSIEGVMKAPDGMMLTTEDLPRNKHITAPES
ncbi:MAG: hypothetical protein H8E09_00805 [Gammaproteobacteria bacterium]|nr:hypothetical protein [Gammaproteobacteria bacterium]